MYSEQNQGLVAISSESLEEQYLKLVLSVSDPFSDFQVSQKDNFKDFLLK